MGKLLVTLTLVAFSSGVLCNVAQNLTEGGSTADYVLPRIKVPGGHAEFYSRKDKCCTHNVPRDYVFLRNKEAYKLHTARLTWNQARATCMDEGGLLAIITSDVDAAKLVNWLRNNGLIDAWIGTHDMFEQGQWVTLTGEPLARAGYDHWITGEPNNAGGNEHCGSIGFRNEIGMNDLTCSVERPFFCKMFKC